ADQYKNENNWKAHYYGTAVEILNEVPGITHFVTGLGTTGSFVGTGRRLKKENPSVRLISLEPDNPLHGLEGWKHLETAVVPEIYDSSVADENIEISTEEAYQMIIDVKEKEGLILSPSSAANLVGAIRVASKIDKGVIVTLLPDNGDKYGEVIKKIFK
ncbi:MAG TPA: pyridoxal-phosphate dependent enzyme, partial [Puia sp.]